MKISVTMSRFLGLAAVLSLGSLLMWAGGISGCNTGAANHNGQNDNSYNATAQDAVDTVNATGNAVLRSYTAAFGGSALEVSGLVVNPLKDAITATSITLCDPATMPSPSGGSARITGTKGGACNIAVSGDASNTALRPNCSGFNDGDSGALATLQGLIGATATSTASGGSTVIDFSQIASQDFTLTLANGNNCTAILNYSAQVTMNADGTNTASVSGCVRVCGESYDVTGSDTF